MVIREANRKDVGGIAVVHVDSWRTTYKDIVPADFLDKMSYSNSKSIFENIFNEKTEDELVLVAELDDKIIGFAFVGPERSNHAIYKSELYSIYILKDYQSMKVGKRLLSSVVQALLLRGINTMLVEVLADNTSKLFYEHMGAKKIGEKYIDRFNGVKLKELVYGWNDINTIIQN